MNGDTIIEDADIVVVNHRIAAIGRRRTVAVPEGAGASSPRQRGRRPSPARPDSDPSRRSEIPAACPQRSAIRPAKAARKALRSAR